MVSEKMRADFARRRAEKAAAKQGNQAEPSPSGNKGKGRAGTLW
jgi:hypothetical protein